MLVVMEMETRSSCKTYGVGVYIVIFVMNKGVIKSVQNHVVKNGVVYGEK